MERLTFKVPGYDCLHAPCNHATKGEHGIHGEEWWYVVKDGDRAVAVSLMTENFPPTVPLWKVRGGPAAGPVSFHREWQEHEHENQQRCEWVTGGKCYSDYGFVLGDEVWSSGDTSRFEQGEGFWTILESYLPDRPTTGGAATPGNDADATKGET